MNNTPTTIAGPRPTLHALLRAAAEPWLESEIEPVIIGWFQQSSPYPDDRTFGMFRLQYGARGWSFGGFSRGVQPQHYQLIPTYEAELEKLAISLREARWNALGFSLLQETNQPLTEEHNPNIEMFLLIDNLECHFGVRHKETRQELYYLVRPDGLQPSVSCPQVWFDSLPHQRNLPVFLPSHMAAGLYRKTAAEFSRDVNWWYHTPLMPQDEAQQRLGDVLKTLFERLSCLGQSVAIATSPQRFNDAAGDANWLAVLVDGHLWENGAYFSSSAVTLGQAPRELHEAMGLLQEVLTCNIRGKFAEYLGSETVSPDTLALSCDERGFLIAFSSSVDEGGPVYEVNPATGLPALIGVTARLDWRFAEGRKTVPDDEYVSDPEKHVVQFVPLDEWIARRTSGEEIPYDYPQLF